MLNPRLAGRYAKSLLDLSVEQGNLEAVHNDMLLLQGIIRSNREFQNLLRSPIISPDKKDKILAAVTEGRITPLTAAFNKLLVAKGRESNLPEIATAFISQYKAMKDIHTVKLTTAAPVSDRVKSAIIARIQSTSAMQNIELETAVDESLIGGFTLQAGDKLVDASILSNLKDIARQFENNDFLYKLQ
jgi:F-type H+-transporting ATPase subunit delta